MKQFSIVLSAFLIPILAACCAARADLSGEIDQILDDKLLSHAAVGMTQLSTNVAVRSNWLLHRLFDWAAAGVPL